MFYLNVLQTRSQQSVLQCALCVGTQDVYGMLRVTAVCKLKA